MSEWVPINVGTFFEPRDSEINGIPVKMAPSPYDAPIAGRAYVENGKLIVEFKYLGSERSFPVSEGDVTLRVAEASRRLYGAEIPLGDSRLAETEQRRDLVARVAAAIKRLTSEVETTKTAPSAPFRIFRMTGSPSSVD